MQEHIRRAHPEHYISKLPATEESFALMINTPPSERPRESTSQGINTIVTEPERNSFYGDELSAPVTPRNMDGYTAASMLPAASAAAALAQLRGDSDWESEPDIAPSIELPGIAQMKQEAGVAFAAYDNARPRQLLPSILSKSPPGRSSTLPPIQRKPSRHRKSSITQNARRPQHERKKSRGEHRNMGYDGRKAFSAEPTSAATAMGKRWEDLIDAATTATTEEVEDDRTPVPRSPPNINRASLPPFPTGTFHSYQASPLQHALTPPTYSANDLPEPFPSIEGSSSTGENFHIESRGLEDSSPNSSSQHAVQIYCAACQTVTLLREAYACCECVCGVCRDCADVLLSDADRERERDGMSGTARRGIRLSRGCPRCGIVGGRWRMFQLDVR
ncbi:MAG: hypothetical protein M1817_002166 [Caeruleum heppii]|nr:MAG: hypothetical protein M1817_002166 [Caeruleum heppii]